MMLLVRFDLEFDLEHAPNLREVQSLIDALGSDPSYSVEDSRALTCTEGLVQIDAKVSFETQYPSEVVEHARRQVVAALQLTPNKRGDAQLFADIQKVRLHQMAQIAPSQNGALS